MEGYTLTYGDYNTQRIKCLLIRTTTRSPFPFVLFQNSFSTSSKLVINALFFSSWIPAEDLDNFTLKFKNVSAIDDADGSVLDVPLLARSPLFGLSTDAMEFGPFFSKGQVWRWGLDGSLYFGPRVRFASLATTSAEAVPVRRRRRFVFTSRELIVAKMETRHLKTFFTCTHTKHLVGSFATLRGTEGDVTTIFSEPLPEFLFKYTGCVEKVSIALQVFLNIQ